MPEHLLFEISQSSMIQPFDQCGPIMQSWKAAGGAQVVAAFVTTNPETVMYPIPSCCGMKHSLRTLISTFSLFGSLSWKFA